MTQQQDIWEGDLLGRETEAIYLERYFENIFKMDGVGRSSFVLNINSEWGYGKTWFLKRFSEQLSENHPVVYFDAWKNDFTKDALLSFVSIICTELSKQFSRNRAVKGKIKKVVDAFSEFAKKAAPVIAATIVKQGTGMAISSFAIDNDHNEGAISDAASNIANLAVTSVVEEFSQKKSAIENFEKSIGLLVSEIEKLTSVHLPIFVFVDELDRCRPTYAIELLESIKHLFSVAGVFFIVATDTRQLSHSIKAVYGQDFNSTSYLKRFFYAEYQLSEPDYKRMADFLFRDFKFYEKLFMPDPLKTDYGFSGFFGKTAKFFKLTARDQEQVFSILKTILLTSSNEVIHYILMLYLICLKHKFDSIDRQWKHTHFLDDYITSGRLESVTILAQYWSSNGDERKEINIKKVFASYLEFLNSDLNSINFPSQVGRYFEYKEQVARKLRDGKKRDESGRYVGKNDLGSYFELLSQAGRMIASV